MPWCLWCLWLPFKSSLILSYLSCASQLNDGYSSTGLLCLRLCSFLWLVMGVGEGATSVSLNAIITAIATWMAIWFIISLVLSESSTFSLTFMVHVCFFSGVTLSTFHQAFFSWHHVMLLASNVITLLQFNYYNLLSAYLKVCIKHEYIIMHYFTMTYIHQMHAWGMAYTCYVNWPNWSLNLHIYVLASYYLLGCISAVFNSSMVQLYCRPDSITTGIMHMPE